MAQHQTRKYTNLVLELIEEGVLDPQTVVEACLAYMSEADVEDMALSNELVSELEEDEEDE